VSGPARPAGNGGAAGDDRLGHAWAPDQVDDIDLAIINLLQVDGRASYRHIADELGVSEATARKRLARLLRDELIQVVAVPNVLASRDTIMAMLTVGAAGDPQALARELGFWPEVTWVALVAGRPDLYVEVFCANREALLALLRRVHALEAVRTVETSVYLKLYKQLYVGPGLRAGD
jgi:Lrp/AsnC family transcriptional regulator, regulator for asnA, asnC and gidA